MAGRDSRREPASGLRASQDSPGEFQEFWEHPGRERRASRKSGGSGTARRMERTNRTAVPAPSPRSQQRARAGSAYAPGIARDGDDRRAPDDDQRFWDDPRARGDRRKRDARRPRDDRRTRDDRNERDDRRAQDDQGFWDDPRGRGDRRERSGRRHPKDARGARNVRGARDVREVRVRPAPPPNFARRQVDGLTAGTAVVVFVVGLSMLAVVENELLTGGPPDPAGAREAVAEPTRSAKPRRSAPPRQAPPTPSVQTLGDRVGDLTAQLRGPAAKRSYGADRPPLTGPIRLNADRTWAFGTTAIPVPADRPAMPHVALYLAQWSGERWRIALSGTAEFNRLLARAPAQLMPPAERRLLARYSSVSSGASATPEGLMLPWRVGGTWTLAAEAGDKGPLGVVSFRGLSGTVLAAGDGRVYRFCATAPGRGLVMVIHPNGLASTYYNLTGVLSVRDGSPVRRGDRLGRIGVDRPCGGAPVDAPQVRFTLRRGNEDVPFAGLTLGGWTFRERADPMLGWAERGPQQVLPGGLLRNFGPVAPPEPEPSGRPTEPPGLSNPKSSPSPADDQER